MTMTAPSRLQTGLVLLLLAIAGGLFVTYNKTQFAFSKDVNATESIVNERIALEHEAPAGSDCDETDDGTCQANGMYKDTEKEEESKEADAVEENDDYDAPVEDENEGDVAARAEQVIDDDEEKEEEEDSSSEEECNDHHEKCEEWASIGECKKNPNYMLSRKGCRKSCLVCGTM